MPLETKDRKVVFCARGRRSRKGERRRERGWGEADVDAGRQGVLMVVSPYGITS